MSFRAISPLALMGMLAVPALEPLRGNAQTRAGGTSELSSTRGVQEEKARVDLRRAPGESPGAALQQQSAAAPPAVSLDPLSAPRCLEVDVSIVTEFERPEESAATLRGPGESRGRLRQFKSRVGAERVVYVGTHPRTGQPTVWLTQGTGLCQASLGNRPPNVPALPPAAHSPPLAGAGHSESARSVSVGSAQGVREVNAVVARIRRLPSGEVHIDRGAVQEVLANPVALLRGVRLAPTVGAGLGLRGIAPGSVLHALGLAEGDRLLSINGLELRGVEDGLAAYARLRSADVWHLEVQRRGATVPLTVEVQ